MKKKVIFLLAGFFLAIALLPSCAEKSKHPDESGEDGHGAVIESFTPKSTDDMKNEEIPGGHRDWSNADAPKSIASKDIIYFECRFLYDESLSNGYNYCLFRMERKVDGALCGMVGFNGLEPIFDQEFTAPLSMLDELQDMIDEHGLVKLNGIDKHTNGLPENLGSLISVTYASGERLYAYDNSGAVLGSKAVLALHDFFWDLARDAGYDCTV